MPKPVPSPSLLRNAAVSLISICAIGTHAQDSVTIALKELTEQDKFDEIIAKYGDHSGELSARGLYYIGHAYYMKEEDAKCISFMDRSIAKDATDPAPHFIKASTLNYMGKYKDAIAGFNTAIGLEPNDPAFHSGMGDAYMELEKPEQALDAYKKATELSDCPARTFLMLGQLYADMGRNEEALPAFYEVKAREQPGSERYVMALYNIGLCESLVGAHEKAEPIFIELLQHTPTDHHAMAKLIQVFYHQQQYEKARPYREKLYSAYVKGELKDNLKDMFCFDQFKWNGHLVLVFERYQTEGNGDIYDKHIFYVRDGKGNTLMRAQTEFSPVSKELGGPKYLLCAWKDGVHYNPGVGFNDDLSYEVLRAEAVRLIEKLMK